MEKFYIGIDLGGTNIKGAIFNDKYDTVIEKRAETEAEKGSEYVLNNIYQLIIMMLKETTFQTNQIAGMGIGVPGLMDIKNGLSQFSPNFTNWENVPVVAWMEKKLHFPVFIDNDVRVNLYGEWQLGAGKDKNNIALLTLGTGLGSGIVMDGHVLYGATASAGEIGHMNMYREGRPCRCGSFGCLGRYVSAVGMLRTFEEKLNSGRDSVVREWVDNNLSAITAKMVSEAYDLGDAVSVETLNETGEILGFGLVNVINLYNPEIIIIGGGMAAAGERLLAKTREVVNNHALKISREACTITTAVLGDSAGMVGAAIYARRKLNFNGTIGN